MRERSRRVESVREEARCVTEAVEDLARVQDKALLQSLGISVPDSTSDSESDNDSVYDDPLCMPESPSAASTDIHKGTRVSDNELLTNISAGTQN